MKKILSIFMAIIISLIIIAPVAAEDIEIESMDVSLPEIEEDLFLDLENDLIILEPAAALMQNEIEEEEEIEIPEEYDFKVKLSNLTGYSIVALNDAFIDMHIRGSLWIGGTLTSNNWCGADDGSINHEPSGIESYIYDNQSNMYFQGRTANQSKDAYKKLSAAAVESTRDYWTNIINSFPNDGEHWIYVEPDENGYVNLAKWDYQAQGSDESQEHIEKIYWTNASKVDMGGLAGHLIAPFAEINITWCNHGGSIVGWNIITYGEAHINYWEPEFPSETPTPTPTPTITPEPTPTPTIEPTPTPTIEPTPTPTIEPTATPTEEPTKTPAPTIEPTETPTPTEEPTATPAPTATPTIEPTPSPTPEITATPTVTPTEELTHEPTETPTAEPTATPTPSPTSTSTTEPNPTPTPIVESTTVPTIQPTDTPIVTVTPGKPSESPRPTPAPTETIKPTKTPIPTNTPQQTKIPKPTKEPTHEPTIKPTIIPVPTIKPTITPKIAPTINPTRTPIPTKSLPTSTPIPTTPTKPEFEIEEEEPSIPEVPITTPTPSPSPTPTPVPTLPPGIIEEIIENLPEPVPNRPDFSQFTDEELEELLDMWGYETPLYGMFQTGDEIPLEIIYAGLIGLLCLILYAMLGKRNI